MQIVHYVLVVSGALAVGLPTTAAAFPAVDRPYFLGAAAICALAATVAGAISDKIGTKKGQGQ
jgi:hypothetical protein